MAIWVLLSAKVTAHAASTTEYEIVKGIAWSRGVVPPPICHQYIGQMGAKGLPVAVAWEARADVGRVVRSTNRVRW